MGWRDWLGTVGAWSVFAASVVAFDPLLRIAGLAGAEQVEKVTAAMAGALEFSIRTGLCRLRLQGMENVPDRGGFIVIGNHQSLVESFVPLRELCRIHPRYVAKKILGRFIPSISVVLRRGGHCLIDRSNHEQSLEAIRALGREVASGKVSAVIFPEGTRSLAGDLQHFKTGGLRALMECAADAEILVMVVHNGTKIYPKGLPRVKAGSVITMRFLPLIDRNDFASVEELIEHIHNLMIKNYTELESEDQQRS